MEETSVDDSEPAWSLPEPKQVLVWGGGASEKWTHKVELTLLF